MILTNYKEKNHTIVSMEMQLWLKNSTINYDKKISKIDGNFHNPLKGMENKLAANTVLTW